MHIHIVKSGETADSIAQMYGVSVVRLMADNNLTEPDVLPTGQALIILFPSQTYTVQAGDTIYSVAQKNDVLINQLYRNNPLLGGLPLIYPGQTLVLSYSQERRGILEVNGYAYPHVDRMLLRKTLPYLTYLTLFTYGITKSGDLIDIDDQELINIALEYGVAPLMLISTLGEDGKFSNALAHTILNDKALQDHLINQILLNMQNKGYEGLDIDFEYILPEDCLAYVDFIQKTAPV